MTEQKIVVSGFLASDEGALLIRRSEHENFLAGYYELPGGKVDFGETPEEALRREFMEETGLDIEVHFPYRTFSYLSHNDERHTVEIVYLVSTEDLSIKLSEDHDDYVVVSIDQINTYRCTEEIQEGILQGFEIFAE